MFVPFYQRKLLAFSISVLFLNLSEPQFVSSETTVFDFPSFSLRNLTLLGDSYLRHGVLGLTRETGVPLSSSGTATFNNPIAFFDPQSNATASFSTRFTFSVTILNPTSFGDGLTFFISPGNQTLGSPGGFLGLVNSTRLRDSKFVAVEFDTRLDSRFNDPNDNHVGLDVGTLVSIQTADAVPYGIDLKSGNKITAWIEYNSDQRKLSVFLSYRTLKPETPILAVDCDLSDHLKGPMYVGFSGSTEGSTELHTIQNWKFKISGFHFHPTRPSIPPHNVTDNSVIPPPITVPDSTSKHRRRIGLGLGIACPAFFCVFLAIFGWISVKKYRGMRMKKSFKAEVMTGPRQFNYSALREATRGFHNSRILGSGAFGTVYRANFQSSGAVSAVKRSKHTHEEGKTEFLAELSIIACLRHKNLVQLQGWCVEKNELLLVYEFMPNGSLDKVLYQDNEQVKALNWSYRYNVAVGLASVLTYLHQECEQQVIHRDIKASNIMLDCNFNARLGDFGLARLMDHDKSPVSTLTAGTMGYLAPEYLQYGKATEKTDVFSYGVVVLEVACGKRPIEREEEGLKMVNLVDWVWGLHSEGRIIAAADPRLKGDFDETDMTKLLLVGLSCANPDSEARPNMRRVMQILNDETAAPAVPRVKPTLTFSSGFLPLNLEDIVSDDEESNASLEDLIEIKVE